MKVNFSSANTGEFIEALSGALSRQSATGSSRQVNIGTRAQTPQALGEELGSKLAEKVLEINGTTGAATAIEKDEKDLLKGLFNGYLKKLSEIIKASGDRLRDIIIDTKNHASDLNENISNQNI